MSLQLEVNGTAYEGWTDVTVSRGIQEISGSFQLTISYDTAPDAPWPIRKGDTHRVLIDGVPVCQGIIDGVNPSYSKTEAALTVHGRDWTGDLADCSALHGSGEFRQQTVEAIAQALCSEYDIKVGTNASSDPIELFRLEQGETVQEALARAASFRSLLLMPGHDGHLLVTRAGTERIATSIVQGENVVAASGETSDADRFSEYRVRGQGAFNDMGDIQGINDQQAIAFDKGIRRRRVLLIEADQTDTGPSFKERAEHTARVRRGRASTYTYTLDNWRHAGGLWTPNTRVQVIDPYMMLDRVELLITRVNYRLNKEEGEACELTLMPPEAFLQLPVDEVELGGLF